MKPIRTSKTPPPGWPTEEEWKKIDKILARAPGTRALPDDAGPVDRFKFRLCEQFVKYLKETKMTQRQLAKMLRTTEARVSEIVHYHLDKVTTDRLIKYLAIIRPKVQFKIS